MTSFKRWFGAGAIVLVALALVACPALVPEPVGKITPMTFTVGDAAQTISDIGDLFTNVNDRTEYKAASDDEAVAKASTTGTTLTVTPGTKVGSATVTVTATLDNGRSATTSFMVTVKAAPLPPPVVPPPDPDNNPPRLVQDELDDVDDLKYGMPWTDDLALRFIDDDEGDTLMFSTETPLGSQYVTASVTSAGMLTLTAAKIAADGLPAMARIDVLVRDGHNAPVRESFDVTVINQAPMKVTEGLNFRIGLRPEESVSFGLTDYFTDPEHHDLTYTASVDPMDVGSASVDNATAMLTIEAGMVGDATVTVTADDSANGTTTTEFTLRVSDAPNMEPEVVGDGIPDQSLVMDFDESMKDLDLSMYFTDPDGDDEDLTYAYTVEPSDDSIVSVSSDPDDDSMITITAEGEGTATITVTASDGDDMTPDMFTVMVSNPPVPTRGSDIGRQEFGSDDRDPRDIILMGHFNNATRYEAVSDDEDVVTAEVDDDHTKVTLTPRGTGTAEVTITPMNSGGSGPSQSFTVEVMAAPMKPVLKDGMSFSDIMLLTSRNAADTADNLAADTMKVFEDLNMYFEDPDKTFGTKALMFSTTTDDDGKKVVTVKEDGTTKNKVTLTSKAVGTATITITATDGDGLSSEPQRFMVTVSTDNSAPEAEATIAEGVIKDVDGDPAENRLDIDDEVKVIDDQLITALFDDPDMARTATARGDTLTFELKFYEAGVTAANILEDDKLRKPKDADGTDDADYRMPLAEDKAQVRGTVLPTTWDGTIGSKMTVTLTALRGSTADTPAANVVAIIATDEFGLQDVQVFDVRVNSKMKAEGVQEKPRSLSGRGDNGVLAAGGSSSVNNGVLEMTWDTSDNARTVALVAAADAGGGHFHDPDGDAVVCSYVHAGDDAATLSLTANVLSITPTKATGMFTVAVTCKDTVGTRFGPSVSDTLTVRITGKTFSQR